MLRLRGDLDLARAPARGAERASERDRRPVRCGEGRREPLRHLPTRLGTSKPPSTMRQRRSNCSASSGTTTGWASRLGTPATWRFADLIFCTPRTSSARRAPSSARIDAIHLVVGWCMPGLAAAQVARNPNFAAQLLGAAASLREELGIGFTEE